MTDPLLFYFYMKYLIIKYLHQINKDLYSVLSFSQPCYWDIIVDNGNVM